MSDAKYPYGISHAACLLLRELTGCPFIFQTDNDGEIKFSVSSDKVAAWHQWVGSFTVGYNGNDDHESIAKRAHLAYIEWMIAGDGE